MNSPASILASFCLALLAGAALIATPESSHGQDESLAVRLPNPDGRDPVFDQSNLHEPVSIEFTGNLSRTDVAEITLDTSDLTAGTPP